MTAPPDRRQERLRRVIYWVKLIGLSVIVLCLAVIGFVWLRYFSPFRSLEARTNAAYTDCAFGDEEACKELLLRYEEGCDQNLMDYCLDLAASYRLGLFISADQRRAAGLYGRFCGQGNATACFLLGRMNDGRPVERTETVSPLSRYVQACELGDGRGCTHAGAKYEVGDAIPQNFKLAAGYYERGCVQGDFPGCYRLGQAHTAGLGVARNPRRGSDLMERACRSDVRISCAEVGALYLHGNAVEHGLRLLEASCADEDSPACMALGLAHLVHPAVERDVEKARSCFLRACDLGDAGACDELAHLDALQTL